MTIRDDLFHKLTCQVFLENSLRLCPLINCSLIKAAWFLIAVLNSLRVRDVFFVHLKVSAQVEIAHGQVG